MVATWTLCIAGWIAPSAAADGVSLQAADGTRIAATHQGSGERGVVLVHDAGRTAGDWNNFATRLAANGFSVLTVDLRGHGVSTLGRELADEDWPRMVEDVDASVSWLAAHGSTSVAVVGAGLGGSLALIAATDGPIARVAILSPSLNAKGVRIGDALGAYKGPLLVVADGKDPAASRTARILGDQAADARVELVDAGSSGHRMLNTVPSLEATLVGWLNGAVGQGAELARPQRKLETGAPGGIETTGQTYGSGN